jgi:hypothetical protein
MQEIEGVIDEMYAARAISSRLRLGELSHMMAGKAVRSGMKNAVLTCAVF